MSICLEDYKKVAEYLIEQHLEKRVLFIDYVEQVDLPAIYKGAELFIYPSIIEGFGIPILEALSCGIPVITQTKRAA